MAISNIYDYIDAGFRVFGLHGIDHTGACTCGNTDCKALYKHPRLPHWQSIPAWSDEQIKTFDIMGHFSTGFGVLVSGFLVLDIDARNGGVDSFRRLCDAVPGACQAGYIVNTGSGGGSQHHYFRLPDGLALVQHLPQYPGIDFKSSGYVVGAGSMHISGEMYDVAKGYPDDVTDAPQDLIALLQKQDAFRVTGPSGDIDIDTDHVVMLLGYIDPGCGYDTWIRVGMAIHHALGGGNDAFSVWDKWSKSSKKYPGDAVLGQHWHSFGKSSLLATYGTLLHHAQAGGYADPVTYVYDGPLAVSECTAQPVCDPLDVRDVDTNRPPGLAGILAAWIESQCRYKMEAVSAMTAVYAISSICGMRYVDVKDGIPGNLFIFGVAGSGTGKDSQIEAYQDLLMAAGVTAAYYGYFKSEQELIRNLVRHQCALYCVDEWGDELGKIVAAKGKTHFLEGIIGKLMSIYTKANKFFSISGDLKEEIKEGLLRSIAQAEKRLESAPDTQSGQGLRDSIAMEIDSLRQRLIDADRGLRQPFLNLMGFSAPEKFLAMLTPAMAKEGFLARAILVENLETNERKKKGFKKAPLPDQLAATLQQLHSPGTFSMSPPVRIEYTGEKVPIQTTQGAEELLDLIDDYFHELAEKHKGTTGMEAIPRRGYELTAKISFVLAMPSGLRTIDHVRWAFAVAKKDTDKKIQVAYGNDNEGTSNGLCAKILSRLTHDHGETFAVLKNRLRAPEATLRAVIQQMLASGMIEERVSIHPKNKTEIVTIFKVE